MKLSDIKFHSTRPNGSRAVNARRLTGRRKDRQTDGGAGMTKVTGAFLEYVKAPNKIGEQ